MKKLFCILFLSLIAISCTDKTTESLPISFEDEEFEASYTNEEGNTEVTIKVPIITAHENLIYDNINKVILEEITELVSFESDLTQTTSYIDLTESFIEAYKDFSQKFPDDNLPWKAKVKADKTFLNNDILSIKIEYYTFAGGAHGYKGKKSLIFDMKQGVLLNQKDLYKDWESISRLLSSKIAYINDLKDSKGIVEYPEDLFIKDDSVIMTYVNPSNFPFTDEKDEIVFLKEDIAPYFKINIQELEDEDQ
ncbi:DUF4163 domain-containing protein [Myroides albus]|uniref:DUF4163 domain-containing protein n=1 Tax=Myroides albus TaxID=2562892 RepID=UPI002158E3BB|nr:DUF4163 domain-containing protein [Myroides albus]UVD80935.1 DUF4163 domain-containing protein [Myroides albus]